MEKADYSIEYCHIYSNQVVGTDQAESIDLLNEIRKRLDIDNKSYVLCVMLDNYTYPDRAFDKNRFLDYLKANNDIPDIFINEGGLTGAADELITLMKPKRARELTKYISEKRYPCSLFIATWYLSRLGRLKNLPKEITVFSNNLINILPEHFEPFEEEAILIIKDTPFATEINNIRNYYLAGNKYPSSA